MAAKKKAPPKKATPRRRGPSHKPTAEMRAKVERLSAVGIPQTEIALIMGICKMTLRKHYEFELQTAAAKANATIGGALYNKAMGGDTTSMIFWLKTRARWRETDRADDENDATPTKVQIEITDARKR